jgi:hypothetical protein
MLVNQPLEVRNELAARARHRILASADREDRSKSSRASNRCFPLELPRRIDRRLPGGGLALGALHEVAGGGNGAVDGAAAALFAAGIAARTKGKVLWCITRADLFAPAYGPGRSGAGPRDLCRGRATTRRSSPVSRKVCGMAARRRGAAEIAACR